MNLRPKPDAESKGGMPASFSLSASGSGLPFGPVGQCHAPARRLLGRKIASLPQEASPPRPRRKCGWTGDHILAAQDKRVWCRGQPLRLLGRDSNRDGMVLLVHGQHRHIAHNRRIRRKTTTFRETDARTGPGSAQIEDLDSHWHGHSFRFRRRSGLGDVTRGQVNHGQTANDLEDYQLLEFQVLLLVVRKANLDARTGCRASEL